MRAQMGRWVRVTDCSSSRRGTLDTLTSRLQELDSKIGVKLERLPALPLDPVPRRGRPLLDSVGNEAKQRHTTSQQHGTGCMSDQDLRLVPPLFGVQSCCSSKTSIGEDSKRRAHKMYGVNDG